MINSNNYQGTVIINSTNQFTGTLNTTYSNIYDYFSLKEANDQLLKENTKLLNQIKNSILKIDSGFRKPDTLQQYIGAKVISNSTHKRNNYIMLNRGKKHGINIDMGVVSNEGIVGVVIGVSENFSYVMSILHKDSKVSAKIKKNNQLANVIWNSTDYKKGNLRDIPTHLNLNTGDTIITSGNSLIFPEGITIGYVEKYFKESGESLNNASLLFASDFNALHYVYVIKNIKKEELINLIKEAENE
jgi:rod shape-determining protein MreC